MTLKEPITLLTHHLETLWSMYKICPDTIVVKVRSSIAYKIKIVLQSLLPLSLRVSVRNQPWRWVVGALTSQLSFPSRRLCHILTVK
jgi:hypothetical protein